MASASDYLEGQLIAHIFRTATFTKPTVLAHALLTTLADDDDTGEFSTSTGVEVTNAGSYARVDHPPLDANWAAPDAGDGVTSNVGDIEWATATGNWGTIVGVGITSSATYDVGNLLFHGALTVNKTVTTDDVFRFPEGNLTVTIA
jgi:hypothetical protein